MQAYVSLLYNEAYDEYGNTLGIIDTLNMPINQCYLDSVGKVEYKGFAIDSDKVYIGNTECTLYQFEALPRYRKKIQKGLARFVDKQ